VVLVVVLVLTILPPNLIKELAQVIHLQELLQIHHQMVGAMMVEMDHMEVHIMVLVVVAVPLALVDVENLLVVLKMVMEVLDT
jgi:hypothetical protein